MNFLRRTKSFDNYFLQMPMAAMPPLLRHLLRPRPYICQQCIQRQCSLPRAAKRTIWAAADPDHDAKWKENAKGIRSGVRKSMLTTLEERGFVKDVAGYDFIGTPRRISLTASAVDKRSTGC
jgi:hypothetical protein